MKCRFCQIITKEIIPHVVYEDINLIAFLDSNPVNEGHVLVVPKRHVLDLDELSDNEVSYLFQNAKRVLKAIKRVYNCDGYSIMINGGIFNDIGHLHIHVFPRKHNDGFGWTSSNTQPSINTKNLPILRECLSHE